MIHLHEVAILVADARSAGLDAPPLDWHPVRQEEIPGVHAGLGHRISDERARQRLANGMRFLRFELAGATVASTWLAGTGGRYLDEFNWLVPLAADEGWLRDVYVAPERRGQRLFARMVTTLARALERPLSRVWSDVDLDNKGSLRAHRAAGFEVIASARCLDVAGRIRLRDALPQALVGTREMAPMSRLLVLHGARRARHFELLA